MTEYSSHRKRKTYALGRSQPPRSTSVTLANGHTEYFDAARAAVVYSFYDVLPNITGSGVVATEYEENVITFSNQSVKSVAFSRTFASTPIVALELISTDSLANISASICLDHPKGFTVRTTAPFTGQFVYRAVRSPTYPVTVFRSPISSSYTSSIEAGYLDLSNQFNALLTYPIMIDPPTSLFVTVNDIYGQKTANVGITDLGPYGDASTPISFSANVTNRLNYIAVK